VPIDPSLLAPTLSPLIPSGALVCVDLDRIIQGYKAALDSANADKKAIRALQPKADAKP
jgi:hypothetical protein